MEETGPHRLCFSCCGLDSSTMFSTSLLTSHGLQPFHTKEKCFCFAFVLLLCLFNLMGYGFVVVVVVLISLIWKILMSTRARNPFQILVIVLWYQLFYMVHIEV